MVFIKVRGCDRYSVLLGFHSLALKVAVGTGWALGCVPDAGQLPDNRVVPCRVVNLSDPRREGDPVSRVALLSWLPDPSLFFVLLDSFFFPLRFYLFI